MTTVSFPVNPITNDVYTFGGRSWQWNGRAWQSVTTFPGYTGSAGANGYTGSMGYTGSQGAGFTGSQGAGITIYELEANLPVSANEGALVYVTATNRMYLYNGTSWILIFTATTANLAPVITAGPQPGYLLSTTGTPVVITMAAQDPEYGPINWSYTITAGTLGNVATIAQNNDVFTITPSTNTAHGGSFELTITASDGVNLANARTFFRLYFTVSEPGYGLNFVSSLAAPTNLFTNSTNANFGKAIAAYGGTLAVLGRSDLSGAVRSEYVYNSVYIYTTLAGTNPVYQTKIDLPVDAGYVTQTKICLISNMLIVGARTSDNASTKWYVYFKSNDTTWTLTQTLVDNSTVISGVFATAVMDISDNGLVFVGANPGVQINIYTRATTATTTWTLRQTIPIANVPSAVANNDIFPTHIKISGSGTHIALSCSNADQISPAVENTGKLVIYTNTTYSSGGYEWGATHTLAGSATLYYITVTASPKYDDIFYVFRETTAPVATLSCIKYSSVNNNWTEYTYDATQVNKFLTLKDSRDSSWINYLDPYIMTAIAGPSDSMSFLCIKRHRTDITIAALVTFKFALADLSTNITNNKLSAAPSGVTPQTLANAYHWNSAANIINPSTGTFLCKPYVDNLTGEVFLAAQTSNWATITGSGVVHRYQLHNSTANAVTKEYISSAAFSALTVPLKCFYMSAVIVGGGGGGGGYISDARCGGGAGGGALVAFSNYPVTPGTEVGIWRGAGGGVGGPDFGGSPGGPSYITYQGVSWIAGGGSGGGLQNDQGGTGGTGGGVTLPTLSVVPVGYSTVSGSGGNGGNGPDYISTTHYGAGGGGAGGYGGPGGNGQNNASIVTSTSGQAGGGGGGGGGDFGGGGRIGGGVGIYGIGVSGNNGARYATGGNGSVDSGLPTANYGYGGSGGKAAYGSTGGIGAVRIIFSDAPIYVFTDNSSTTIPLVRNPNYTGS